MHLLPLFLAVFSGTDAFPNSATAQCCLGAQHIVSDSIDGRFRVEAKSLTGTGPLAHGPYHFQISFLERSGQRNYDTLHQFKLKWDTTAHFNMKLLVSPTGNGFAVLFPSKHLAIYSFDGNRIYESEEERQFRIEDNGYNIKSVELVQFGRQGLGVEDQKVFLPLSSEATRQLGYQVIWYLYADPDRLDVANTEIETALQVMHSGTSADRLSARKVIQKYGPTAIPILLKAESQKGNAERKTTIKTLLHELSHWRQYSSPDGWRDLNLIAALLYYPDSEIQRRARIRLESWLAIEAKDLSVDELHDWVLKHRSELNWDGEVGKYLMRSNSAKESP